jgi:hypothetical protein
MIPFVAQLARRNRTILTPKPAPRSNEGKQWLLSNRRLEAFYGDERGDWPSMSRYDRRLTLLCRIKQLGKLIAGDLGAFTECSVWSAHGCMRTVPYG